MDAEDGAAAARAQGGDGLACGDAHIGRAPYKRNMSVLRVTGVIQGQAGCFLDETRAWLEC